MRVNVPRGTFSLRSGWSPDGLERSFRCGAIPWLELADSLGLRNGPAPSLLGSGGPSGDHLVLRCREWRERGRGFSVGMGELNGRDARDLKRALPATQR